MDDHLTYSSQWVLVDMNGKADYSDYIRGKLDAIRKTGGRAWAEIGYTDAFGAGPCVVLAQGTEENLKATLLIKMRDDKIEAMAMCCLPSPYECRRTGERPM